MKILRNKFAFRPGKTRAYPRLTSAIVALALLGAAVTILGAGPTGHQPDPDCPVDDHGVTSNATPIQFGVRVTGLLCGPDADSFKFQAVEGKFYMVRVKLLSGNAVGPHGHEGGLMFAKQGSTLFDRPFSKTFIGMVGTKSWRAPLDGEFWVALSAGSKNPLTYSIEITDERPQQPPLSPVGGKQETQPPVGGKQVTQPPDDGKQVSQPPGGGEQVSQPPEDKQDREVSRPKLEIPSTQCPVMDVGGWFEPVQGVWQDDYVFPDKKGKRLVEKSPTKFVAELPMVAERDTLIFGTRGPENLTLPGPTTSNKALRKFRKAQGERGADPKRDSVPIFGTTTGTTEVPVRLEIRRVGQSKPIFSGKEVQIFLDSPCGEPRGFVVQEEFKEGPRGERGKIKGLPYEGTFKIPKGHYTLEAELMRGNVGTGIKLTLEGESLAVKGPKTHFVPVVLSASTTGFFRANLKANAAKLEQESKTYIPDYYPLPKGGLPTKLQPEQDLSKQIDETLDSYGLKLQVTMAKAVDLFGPKKEEIYEVVQTIRTRTLRNLSAALADLMSTKGALAGAERVVAVVSKADWGRIGTNEKLGLTKHTKVFFVREDVTHWVVGHELAHTLPVFDWDNEHMKEKCGLEYHNESGGTSYGHGFRIVKGSGEDRREYLGQQYIMGGGHGTDKTWITQCTYWHLIEGLRQRKDPEAILVRAVFLRVQEGIAIGALLPSYQLETTLDVAGGGSGSWAIVLRDVIGNELGRNSFEPAWEISPTLGGGGQSAGNLVSDSQLVLAVPGVARIDLVGPLGVLDSLVYSANPPSVTITAPDPGVSTEVEGGKVRMEWDAADPDGDELLYSTFYSSDGGETWLFGAFEQTKPAYEMSVDPEASQHMVKVIATDGVRSTDEIVAFSLATGDAVETQSNRVPTASATPASAAPVSTKAPIAVISESAPTPQPPPTKATEEVETGGGCFAPLGGGGKADVSLFASLFGVIGLLAVRRRFPGRS